MRMDEKLRQDHERTVKMGIGGHCIGFFADEDNEPINLIYLFRAGKYRMEKFDTRAGFYWWGFEPNVVGRLSE